jgi:cold shock protein
MQERVSMATGTVKWFNTQKGFGFIAPDGGGTDAFVHISAVERAGLNDLLEGQKIEFDLVADKKSGKMAAENLKNVAWSAWRISVRHATAMNLERTMPTTDVMAAVFADGWLFGQQSRIILSEHIPGVTRTTSCVQETRMSKEQKRGNREIRKPKAIKQPKPGDTPSVMTRGSLTPLNVIKKNK